jgi:hypothetical protein
VPVGYLTAVAEETRPNGRIVDELTRGPMYQWISEGRKSMLSALFAMFTCNQSALSQLGSQLA